MPQRQSVGNDLDAPCVSDWHIEVHVGQPDVTGDPRAGFTADARDFMLEGQGARRQDPGGGAGGTMIAQGIKLSMAGASARRER